MRVQHYKKACTAAVTALTKLAERAKHDDGFGGLKTLTPDTLPQADIAGMIGKAGRILERRHHEQGELREKIKKRDSADLHVHHRFHHEGIPDCIGYVSQLIARHQKLLSWAAGDAMPYGVVTSSKSQATLYGAAVKAWSVEATTSHGGNLPCLHRHGNIQPLYAMATIRLQMPLQ